MKDVTSRSIETEQAMLGAMLACIDGVPSEIPELVENDFIEPLHWRVYSIVKALMSSGRKADPVQVHARLYDDETYRNLGGAKYLSDLVKVAGFAPITDYADTLRALNAKRRLFAIAQHLADEAADPSVSADDAVSAVWPDLDAIRAGAIVRPQVYADVVAAQGAALTAPRQCYSTGLVTLDRATEGGLYAGKLYGFAARMKVGKTVLLSSIARALNRADVPTLYVALEMGAPEITQRIIGADLGINAVRFLRRDDPTLPERIARYVPTAGRALMFEDRPGLTLDQLRSIVAGYVARHNVRVVLVDYWQLVCGQRRGQTQADHLAESAQWMADAAKHHGIAIVTAAQINRLGETLGGDGLRRACSMYIHLHKVTRDGDNVSRLWAEMEDSRYTARTDIGSEEEPLWFIDSNGPSIGEYA